MNTSFEEASTVSVAGLYSCAPNAEQPSPENPAEPEDAASPAIVAMQSGGGGVRDGENVAVAVVVATADSNKDTRTKKLHVSIVAM